MDGAETIYGQDKDVCDVCGLPLGSKPVIQDELDKRLIFCSKRCFEQYLKEPDKYIDFEEPLE